MKYPPRWSVCLFVLLFVIAGVTLLSGEQASANHPVLVEGNCDSPVPGTTIVNINACGDYDGDGRIGTAEDTDGADRIFGTISGALGPGTGAAAGTGANFNGRIIIVRSGRFAEVVVIQTGSAGHVQIEAAPGVEANIDAVLQGDPAGGNNGRQGTSGIYVDIPGTVTLRNLTVRNFLVGLEIVNGSRVYVDNCRFENNLDIGIRARILSRLIVNNSHIINTGRRVGTAQSSPSPGLGNGIQFEEVSGGVISNTVIAQSSNAAIRNLSGNVNIRTFHLVFADNDGGNVVGNPVIKENY
ncbi:MAG TPA: right-handed parallel beta-helix repeat-containing protein [Pyrinomonadaceae bacterium]|nr:right-handed parallel beta-helix repeat-containing protein [Pyrinomonadaceae bacterium]